MKTLLTKLREYRYGKLKLRKSQDFIPDLSKVHEFP